MRANLEGGSGKHVTPHPVKRVASRSDAAQRTNVSRTHPENIAKRKTAYNLGRTASALGPVVSHVVGFHLSDEPHHAIHHGHGSVDVSTELAKLRHLEGHVATHHSGPSFGTLATLAPALVAGPLGAVQVGLNKTAEPFRKAGAALAVAAYHDPVGVPVKTAKGGLNILKATPSGIVNTLIHPEATAKAAVKDYKHRYGQDFDQMVKRFRAQGAAPEVADALTVATLGDATLGRAAMSAAESRGLSIATRARPAVRVSGGIVHEQELANRLGRALVQRGHDALRANRTAKAATKVAADPIVKEAAQSGEVAVLRRAMFGGKLDRSQAKAVAATKSRAVLKMKSAHVRVIDKGARRVLARLNKNERRAFYYVATGQAPAERAGFESFLKGRVARIHEHRDGHQPEGLMKLTDELHTIPKIDTAKVDFAKLRAVHLSLRQDALRAGREDPALNAAQRLQRRYSQQAATLGIRRGEMAPSDAAHGDVPGLQYANESVPDYIRRVQKAADAAGLERPVYFPSEHLQMDLNPDHASRAIGGMRAAAGPHRYEGKNFDLGIQDTSPETFITGLARNIKRAHNWQLVSDLKDQHAIGGLEGTAQAVRQQLHNRGIDPKSYVLWNPRIFHGEMTKLASDTPSLRVENHELSATSALAKSIDLDAHDASGAFAQRSGWVAIPKQAFKEIEDSTKPSGAIGRSWDIFKGKNSRLLLGAGNIPWLQFQVASNALLAGFATKGGLLHNLPAAKVWYERLDQPAKDEIDALLGSHVTYDVHQPHLGAAANNGIVNAYRAFKDLPVWDAKIKGRGPSIRQLNPIEAMFNLDHAQNAFFKRAVLYNAVKRDAFKRMGENMSLAEKLQARVTNALSLGPEEAMRQIVHDQPALERHAEAVNNWLGDYVTYTARERKVISRSVMFYGFLRFSLKFAFYTMPVKHPLETAIVGKLGQLQATEVQDLLGGKALPWSFGKLYLTKDGQLQEVDLTRANPALNTLSDAVSGHPTSLVSLAPPMLVSLAEQFPGVHRRIYFDRDFRVRGGTAPYAAKDGDYTLGDRARIMLDETLGMAAPYRIAEKMTQSGPQGDDSLLWSPRPTVYKRADILKSIAAQAKRDRKGEDLAHQLIPFLPRPSSDKQLILERSIADQVAHAPKKKSRKRGGYQFSGSSSGYQFGGG